MNLLFSLPGIASNYCRKCREHTMHKFCRCVHCGTALETRPSQAKYHRAPRRKAALSPEQRREVVRKVVAGISPFAITAEYGISYSTLKRTVSGHR